MNNTLLRRYVEDHSEEAFGELVRQHIDLVYSAALRQVNGDSAIAQDVTQAVFTDLARKAAQLTRHASLTGWLYTSTRFLAAKARRSEQRRRAREQQAHTMSQLLQTTEPDPGWNELAPLLDEVMHELKSADRDAVLMRYFEERPLAEIGAHLGLSDNAARMRVERSLDKLREALTRRGISLTLAALGLMLCERAVQAAPGSLSTQVSRAALAAGTGGGLALLLWKLTTPAALKWTALLLTALGIAIWVAWPDRAPSRVTAAELAETASTATFPSVLPSPSENVPAASTAATTTNLATVSSNQLRVQIVTSDNGKPVPSVSLDYWLWVGGKVNHKRPLVSSRFGICEVPVPQGITRLILVSEVEGFADTRLEWNVERGAIIPQEYTLRLVRGVAIGGTVVDADDQPVAGAEIGFNNEANPAQETFPESRNFSWPFWVTAKTDQEGRWRLERITKEVLHTIHGSASHPDHINSEHVFVNRSSETEQQMLAGTHVFRLGRAMVIAGMVVDSSEQPIAGAKVRAGQIGSSGKREATTAADGQFRVAGCKPGKISLSAEAKGFAPVTVEVEALADSPPFRLTLKPGNMLRVRVVDGEGAPIKGAKAWLDTFARNFPADANQPPPIQVEFNRTTDAEGRIEWNEAPDQELTFHFSAPGFMRIADVKLRPSGQEHLVTLPAALTISGTVRDAETGQPVPRFRIVTGWPQNNPVTGALIETWSTIDRFWLSFQGGKFHHVFEEPVVIAPQSPRFIFKVEAEGYASHVTRVVNAEETKAEFDIRLDRASQTQVTVQLPDGRPAAQADIGFVSPSAQLRLVPGGFERARGQSGSSLATADEAGRFNLSPDPRITRVIAVHVGGYAESSVATLAAQPTLTLQPWGRLEGAISGLTNSCSLLFQYGDGDYNSISCDFARYQVKTGPDGRFLFPAVPPGKHQLVELVPSPSNSSSGMTWTHKPLTAVDIRPGETTTLALEAH